MSIEALNWAFKQRLKDPQTQLVLVALAWAADPDGLAFGWRRSKRHWDEYLVARSRLGRSTVFRKIADLREIELLDPQVVIHPDGFKQHIVQLNLARIAFWDEALNGAGDYRMHSLREHIEELGDTDLDEAAIAARFDDATPGDDAQSRSETQRLVRGVFRTTDQSRSGTPAVDNVGEESRPGTERVPLAGLHKSQTLKSEERVPQTPAASREASGPAGKGSGRVLGFNLFQSLYPQGDVIPQRAWDRAAEQFEKLSEGDRDKVVANTPRYAERIRSANRKALNPDTFLRDREFERYGATALIGLAAPHTFVPEGTEAWEAWCNFLSVVYGDPQTIPRSYQSAGPRGARGLNVPASWPLGGEGWRVPHDQWVFVERFTPNYQRYDERAKEVLGRQIMAVRATARFVRADCKRIGRGPDGALSDPACFGALVPREWPPAKGEGVPAVQLAASDALRRVVNGN